MQINPQAAQITVLFIVAIALTFGTTYYFCWGQFVNENLIYMAKYNEHLALQVGRTTEAGSVYWTTAFRYCALYRAERRTLPNVEHDRICEDIINGSFHNRGDDFGKVTVYFSAVFNAGPPMCKLGREILPCPTMKPPG